MSATELMIKVSVWILPLLLAITLHEAAHGYAAWKLGDDTAYRLGRVTFNPLRHIDLFGTLLMPAFLLLGSGGRVMFGFAKPVPVNFHRLRNPRGDMVLVALAGPGTNLALAFVSAVLFHTVQFMPPVVDSWLFNNLYNSVWLNVILAVFNMLPIPPLDGGRVAVGLLPDSLALPLARMERYGVFIVLGAIFLLPWVGEQIGMDLNVFSFLIGDPANYIVSLIMLLAGVS